MLTKNLDLQRSLVNGARGVILRFQSDSASEFPSFQSMLFLAARVLGHGQFDPIFIYLVSMLVSPRFHLQLLSAAECGFRPNRSQSFEYISLALFRQDLLKHTNTEDTLTFTAFGNWGH